MTKIAIIIPTRLEAKRLPNKPLKLIKNKEMILHVYDLAAKAQIGEVYVATPDKQIIDLVKAHGGRSIATQEEHQTGTDRINEVFKKELKEDADVIINLQGDMPNLQVSAIKYLAKHMELNSCDIGTLASKLDNNEEMDNENICKVITKKDISNNNFSNAIDFFRLDKKPVGNFIYHHIGIYAFTREALIRYVGLERSKLEIKRNLEQLRALEDGMKIDVGYINSYPLSVDTQEDFDKIKIIMEN